MGTANYSVSASGVILNANRTEVLLIQRRDNGHWEPPGGIVETNESLEAAAIREIKEETGLDVRVKRLTGAYKNVPRSIVALVFECEPCTTKFHTTAEASAVKWWPIENLSTVMTDAYRVRVLDALRETAGTAAHDGTHLLPS